MRNLSTLISSRAAALRRPSEGQRRTDAKPAATPRPAPRRCLNEGAHKLDR